MKALLGIGVTAERVFAAINVAGIEEIGLDELADLFTMYQGVKNGDTNVDDVFPAVRAKGDAPATLKGKLDQLADGDDPKSPPQSKNSKSDAAVPQASSDQQPGKQSTPAASGAEPSSDQSPPRSDDGDLLAAATRKGRAAYRKGMSRKAVPADFKAPEKKAELDAYLAGFDDEADNDAPEPGSTEEDA